MSLTCPTCQKKFNTNAGLYAHKEKAHKKPSVILVSHDKHNDSDKRKEMAQSDSENDDGMITVDEDSSPDQSEADEGLEVIDEYNDGDAKSQKSSDDDMKVVNDYDRRKRRHSDDDDQVKRRRLDPEHDEGLEVVDEFDRRKKKLQSNNARYKNKLEQCLKKHKNLTAKLEYYKTKFDEDIKDLKLRFKTQMADKEIECEDKVKKVIKEWEKRYQEAKSEHDSKIADMESEHGKRIKALEAHLQDLKDDDSDFSELSKIIFNCTTIEEISEIQSLIENHRIDDVIQNHLPTLQNLLLGLSFGVIPICDSQRRAISDSQRKLVRDIHNSNKTKAKNIIKRERREIINLFSIIRDSLKLVRDSFNRYDIRES